MWLVEDRLALVIGERAARVLLEEALAAARRSEVPPDAREATQFVRGYVIEPLALQVGAAAALAFLDDIRDQLGKASGPISSARSSVTRSTARIPRIVSRPIAVGSASILIVDADLFARSQVARKLIQTGVDIRASDHRSALESGAAVSGIVMYVRCREEVEDARRLLDVVQPRFVVLVGDPSLVDKISADPVPRTAYECLAAGTAPATVSAVVLSFLTTGE